MTVSTSSADGAQPPKLVVAMDQIHAGQRAIAALCLAFIVGAVVPAGVRAQLIPAEYADTTQTPPAEARTEKLREAREEKRRTVVDVLVETNPEEAGGFLQSTFARVAQIDPAQLPRTTLGLPLEFVLGGLRSGAGPTLGLRFEPFAKEEGPYLSITGRGSLERYWNVQSILGYDAGLLTPYLYGSYVHIPQEKFYGVGPETTDELLSNYRWNRGIAGALMGIQAHDNLSFGGHVSYQHNDLGAGRDKGLPDLRNYFLPYRSQYERLIPGLNDQGNYIDVNYMMLGGYAEFDTRQIITEEHGIIDLPGDGAYNSRFAPIEQRLRGISLDADQGVYLAAEAIRHQAFESAPYSFTRYKLEAQEYIPFRHGFQVLALRQFGAFSMTREDDEVPFYMMETLGGNRTIRGFDTFRFRDRNVLVANNEFRWQAWFRLDMALFLDAGYSFKNLKDFELGEVETGYGVGFRFKSSRTTAARLDIAWSREGVTTYLKIGAFI